MPYICVYSRYNRLDAISKHQIQRDKLMKNRIWVTFLLISPFNGIKAVLLFHFLPASFIHSLTIFRQYFLSHLPLPFIGCNEKAHGKCGAGGNKAVKGLQNMGEKFCNMLSTGKTDLRINIWNKVLLHYPAWYVYFLWCAI